MQNANRAVVCAGTNCVKHTQCIPDLGIWLFLPVLHTCATWLENRDKNKVRRLMFARSLVHCSHSGKLLQQTHICLAQQSV